MALSPKQYKRNLAARRNLVDKLWGWFNNDLSVHQVRLIHRRITHLERLADAE